MNARAITPRIAALLLVLCIVAAYLPALGAGYIWDDDALLTANPQVSAPHGMANIWQGKNSRDYTPLTISTFRLEWKLWGGFPAGYHAVNVLLHALSAVLLWRVLLAMGVPGAWLAALLFGIHPVNVASVAWIAERKNTLSGALFFGSMLCFFKSRGRWNIGLYALAVTLFVLAGLSKGSVVVLPAVLLICVLWMDRTITRRDVAMVAPFGVIAAVIAWLTVHYQMRGVDYGLEPQGAGYRLARAGYAVWHYLAGIFVPVGMGPFCAPWVPDLHSFGAWVPVLAASGLLALFACKYKGWWRPLFFVYACYLVILSPALGFVRMLFQQETPCADWWQYLAAPCIFALIGAGCATVLALVHGGTRNGFLAVICAAMALLFVQTWRRCEIYTSMETYCRAVIAENPHAWSMQNNLGVVLKKRGDFAGAVDHYRQALEDNPRFIEAHNNLGNALGLSGDLRGAQEEFNTALGLQPGNADIMASLAAVYLADGKVHDAFATQAAAVKADRTNPARYEEFGRMLAAQGHYDKAIDCYNNALLLSPGDARVQAEMAEAEKALNKEK